MRVQHPTLYYQYAILRSDMARRLGKNEEEVEKSPLWHGASFDVVSKIVADKFDRRFTGAHGKYLQQCEHFTVYFSEPK